jgi:hypothetical protein
MGVIFLNAGEPSSDLTCNFCGHTIDDADLMACDRCGKVFCMDCQYARSDDIPEDWCPDCCDASPPARPQEEA